MFLSSCFLVDRPREVKVMSVREVGTRRKGRFVYSGGTKMEESNGRMM